MKSLRVLDVTLRDGGCVNDFNFGTTYIDKIITAQEEAGIDIIELGYIDDKNGSIIGRTKYLNEKCIHENVLKHKKNGIEYVAMIDYGKFNIDNLESCICSGIDGIRMAFHKKDKIDMISLGKKIIQKGYKFYIQPMITLRYSDAELIELIDMVNKELPNAAGFYIVDSFGEMRPNDMSRMLNLVDHNLISSMSIGFHSHNNLQLSYSNAMTLLQFPTNRDFIIDCSIMGMGKGAGNLNTELLLEHLNSFYGKGYKIAPLLEVMDKVLNQLHDEYYWGYAPEYYLSSTNHCTPSYASHFYSKHMLSIDQVGELLGLIDEEKKESFDAQYAEELYRKYNERKEVDDTAVIEKLQQNIKGKTVVLVAPGKSVGGAIDSIKSYLKNQNAIVIGLNSTLKLDFDYLLTTRKDVYEKARIDNRRIIVPSNLAEDGESLENVMIIDYKKWIDIDEKIHDSSVVIAIKLINVCEADNVRLIGLDGFSANINENYYDADMRWPISVKQVQYRNAYYKKFFEIMKKSGMKIVFETPSLYE